MKKRIVAFAARVSCLPTDELKECKKKKSEENAFHYRSTLKTKEIYQFSNGWDIINALVNNREPAINEIVIHDHGFRGGIIGDGDATGLYTEDYFKARRFETQATAGRFGFNVMSGLINLAPDCRIVIFGCNVSLFAQELSRRLGDVGRADVTVTGADNNVYEENGMAKVDTNEKGINPTTSSGFITFKNGVAIGSIKRNWSYR